MFVEDFEPVVTVISSVMGHPAVRRNLRRGAIWTLAGFFKMGDALAARRRPHLN